MRRARNAWLMLVGLAALTQVGIVPPAAHRPASYASPDADTAEAESTASPWLRSAHGTQATTRSRLRVTDQESCADASYVSYRRSDVQADVADQWYVASQLWADAELLRATDATRGSSGSVNAADDGHCHLAKGFQFLERLLDAGGYSARAAPDGSNVALGLHYADDNAVAGLSLLAAADVERDPVARERYLTAARSVAAFLTTSGLWDEMFGGGYNLEVGVDRIYASYGAWTSLGHLALYDLDGDPTWLDLAQRNADALDSMFRRADGGYGWRHFRCVTPIERSRPGCEGGESVWVVDQTHDGAAQARMQHLQAAIAHRLTTRALDLSGCFRRTAC